MTPSGLAMAEAILAIDLVRAIPTEQVIPTVASTSARICSATSTGVQPIRRSEPDTSRNASSRLSGSTKGVTDRKTAMTCAEAAAYSGKRGGTKSACGHNLRAWATGIADRTPDFRAA